MLIPRNVTPVTNKTQTKILSANVTTNTTVSDLTFNNLTVGKWYELTGQLFVFLDFGAVNDDAITITINNGATVIAAPTIQIGAPDTQTDALPCTLGYKFLATATTVTFVTTDASANSLLIGNNLRTATFAQLTELNDTEITTAFT